MLPAEADGESTAAANSESLSPPSTSNNADFDEMEVAVALVAAVDVAAVADGAVEGVVVAVVAVEGVVVAVEAVACDVSEGVVC